MSFFAVLDAQDESSRGSIKVLELHVNVWSLASLNPLRRSVVVDIGVRLEATKGTVNGISLAMPFRALGKSDLSARLTDNRTASLIFDSQSWYNPEESKLYRPADDMRLLRMDARSGLDVDLSSESLTVWRVNFVTGLKAKEVGYYRMRFEVEPGRSWQAQPPGFMRIRNGLLVDLRVMDVRSTIELPAGESILSRVLEIERAYIFAVLPQAMVPATVSPEPNYIRLLEPRVWGHYLDRKAEFFGRRLVVHQWKSDSGEKVTRDEPMRLYGRFSLRDRFVTLKNALVAVLVTIVAVALLLDAPFKPEIITWWDGLVAWFAGAWQIIFVPLGIGLASFAISTFRWLRWLKDWFGRAERWIFRKIFRPES